MGAIGNPLHTWLRRNPQPAKLRLDGRLIIAVSPDGKSRWADCIESIGAAGATKVEALNEAGETLRTTRVDVDESLDLEEAAAKRARDAEQDKQGQFVQIARLIQEANDAGAARHADAYSLAFDKMVGMVQILSDRMAGLESAWQGTLESRAVELQNATPEAEEVDPAGAAIGTLIQMAAARDSRASTTPNTPAQATVQAAVVKAAVQRAARSKPSAPPKGKRK